MRTAGTPGRQALPSHGTLGLSKVQRRAFHCCRRNHVHAPRGGTGPHCRKAWPRRLVFSALADTHAAPAAKTRIIWQRGRDTCLLHRCRARPQACRARRGRPRRDGLPDRQPVQLHCAGRGCAWHGCKRRSSPGCLTSLTAQVPSAGCPFISSVWRQGCRESFAWSSEGHRVQANFGLLAPGTPCPCAWLRQQPRRA